MIEGVGFAIIEIQNNRLITSSKFYFQALLSAIALPVWRTKVDNMSTGKRCRALQ
jgi:hypothetical protein